MSTPVAVRKAATAAKSKSKTQPFSIPNLAKQSARGATKGRTSSLFYTYEPRPQPVNSTTFASTMDFLTDPSHPLHIRANRRFAAFDPNILHWTVRCSADLSKKASVRTWARRRVREAFRGVLREAGLDSEGRVVDGKGKVGLKGALFINLGKKKAPELLKASGEGLKGECGELLKAVLKGQAKNGMGGTSGSLGSRAKSQHG